MHYDGPEDTSQEQGKLLYGTSSWAHFGSGCDRFGWFFYVADVM